MHHLSGREADRVHYLVLGNEREKPKKSKRARARRNTPPPIDAGIAAALETREIYGGRRATPETLLKADIARMREGSLARLYRSGALTAEQLASAETIGLARDELGAEVSVRTASLETRVDMTRLGDGTFYERLGRVRREIAYRRWCEALGARLAPALAMIADDVGFTHVARHWRMHNRRAKQLLLEALDLWPDTLGEVARNVGRADLDAVAARLA